MKRSIQVKVLAVVALAGLAAAARAQTPKHSKTLPPCSTEIVNDDCTLTIDRYYPVTQPTIQLRKGKKITVQIANPLPYEMLSLDLQSATAIAGTDPTSALITSLLGQAKSLLASTKIAGMAKAAAQVVQPTPAFKQAMLQLNATKFRLDTAAGHAETFGQSAIGVYGEISEVAGVIDPQELADGQRPAGSPLTVRGTPIPWRDFSSWRNWMLCELSVCPTGVTANPPVNGLLGTAATLTNELTGILTACPTPAQSANIDCQIKALFSTDTTSFTPDELTRFGNALQALNAEFASLGAANVGLGNVVKDLGGNYLVNIEEWSAHNGVPAGTRQNPANPAAPLPVVLLNIGQIPDPADIAANGSSIAKLLGRQVVFAADAVNQVTTPTASVITATQKKAFASITVLFADPILEASAGTFFSFLANRSFSNQTLVMQNAGAPPTPENVVITQTITRPTVIPFAAANLRLGHDFLLAGRRSAFYWTGAVGVNTYNSTTEFASGPTLSWRSLMVSAFLHVGHDMRLTQGEYVNEVWCNQTAAAGSVGKCSGNPPSPTMEKYWRREFAIGVSVRIPAVFGGTGH